MDDRKAAEIARILTEAGVVDSGSRIPTTWGWSETEEALGKAVGGQPTTTQEWEAWEILCRLASLASTDQLRQAGVEV